MLRKIWADVAHHCKELTEWCQQQGHGWELEVVERTAGTASPSNLEGGSWSDVSPGFFAIGGWPRTYERRAQTSKMHIELVVARLLVRRLAKHMTPGAKCQS